MISRFSRNQLYLFCFLIALIIRLILIYFTIGQNESIDLSIYRDTGQLVANGVNPYDFTDNIAFRASLRLDNIAYNSFTCDNQPRWDYFANSNLPLSSLTFGLIEFLFHNSLSYRIVFAVCDSFLAVLVLAFILDFWNIDISQANYWPIKKIKEFVTIPRSLGIDYKLILGFFLGAFNPILLLNGTVIPEHKGIGLLFILAAIYFSLKPQRKYFLLLSAISLGFSVAFIGLGVFLAPFCLYNIYKKASINEVLIYLFLSVFSCVCWLIPFMPELYTMMEGRMLLQSKAGLSIPLNSSPWVIFYNLLGENWRLIKYFLMAFFVAINIYGFMKNRINIPILSASFLYLFINLFLIDGSMDRMNIGLLVLILLLGLAGQRKITLKLISIYLIYGFLALAGKHYLGLFPIYDSAFNLLFMSIFIFFLTQKSFRREVVLN